MERVQGGAQAVEWRWLPNFNDVSRRWHVVDASDRAICGTSVSLRPLEHPKFDPIPPGQPGRKKIARRKAEFGTFLKCALCLNRIGTLMDCGCGCDLVYWPEEAFGCFASYACALRFDPIGMKEAREAMIHYRRKSDG